MERGPMGIFWLFSEFFRTPEHPERDNIVVRLNAWFEQILGDKTSIFSSSYKLIITGCLATMWPTAKGDSFPYGTQTLVHCASTLDAFEQGHIVFSPQASNVVVRCTGKTYRSATNTPTQTNTQMLVDMHLMQRQSSGSPAFVSGLCR